MKFYRCLDCRDTDKPGCELYIDGDTQPPNVCPYRYGETWEKNGGKCGWEFVGVTAEMSMESGPLPMWRCDCGTLQWLESAPQRCCGCGAAYTPDKRED